MEEIPEPTLVQTLRAHRSEVTCADASGALLVTGSGDRSLRLWRWSAGAGWDERARVLQAHRYGVTCARWAASGALLASAGVDGAARVWEPRALAPRRLLAAPGARAARSLCWAARARLLVGHDDGALCVWHASRGTLLARLHPHEGALHALAAPARGALLLTACTDGVLKVFDLAEVCRSGIHGEDAPAPLAWEYNVHDLGALCADVTEDGALCATGGQDALVRLWRLGAAGAWPGGAGQAARGHAGAVTALRWARGGGAALLASAAADRSARLWRPHGAALRCVRVLQAHARYLTCVVLAHDARYMLTGSNDRSLRMWSLSSLTLDDQLDIPCDALSHFGLGDLQGIGPVDDEEVEQQVEGEQEEAEDEGEGEGGGGLRRVWAGAVHAGPINDIATHADLVATASSDGSARVFRWDGAALHTLHTLAAHQYPALCAHFAAGGRALLTAGLDARAALWDVESGVQLRAFSADVGGETRGEAGGEAEGEARGAEVAGGEAGGGGVRAARASPRGQLLLGTDDGLTLLWSLDNADPKPLHVATWQAAVTCAAWSRDGRLAAAADAAGELRVLAPPACLLRLPHAHYMEGVQSCDFAPSSSELELPENTYLLATAGADSLLKLWSIEYDEESQGAAVRGELTLQLQGGGAAALRWAGALLAAAGADGVLRVWRVAREGGGLRARVLCSLAPRVPAASVALLARGALLLAGSLRGALAAWRVPEPRAEPADAGAPPRLWLRDGVRHWLAEYIVHVPGSELQPDEETLLYERAEAADMTGAKLLSASIDCLLQQFGYEVCSPAEGKEGEKGEEGEEGAEGEEGEGGEAREQAARARLRDELGWLRAPPPSYEQEQAAPHALRCPLSHRLLRDPVRAADGYTYERANILDWFLAAEGAVSPVSGRRLASARLRLNYGVRSQLRDFLRS